MKNKYQKSGTGKIPIKEQEVNAKLGKAYKIDTSNGNHKTEMQYQKQ